MAVSLSSGITHNILHFFATHFPSLGYPWRYLRAFVESKAASKDSYSQQGEDAFIWGLLQSQNLYKSIYIDVGGNHPTTLSNTFLLYRKGLTGLIFEPNRGYERLFRRFRPRDIFFCFGCGSTPEIMVFKRVTVPTHNFLEHPNSKAKKPANNENLLLEFIPVFPLDHVLATISLDFDTVSLLNIDAEGMDYDVLLGAKLVLQKTIIVCIEANEVNSRQVIRHHLTTNGFLYLKQMGPNLIFKNAMVGPGTEAKLHPVSRNQR